MLVELGILEFLAEVGIEIGGLGFESGIGIEQWDYNRWGVGIEMTIDIEYWIDIDGCGVAGFMKN